MCACVHKMHFREHRKELTDKDLKRKPMKTSMAKSNALDVIGAILYIGHDSIRAGGGAGAPNKMQNIPSKIILQRITLANSMEQHRWPPSRWQWIILRDETEREQQPLIVRSHLQLLNNDMKGNCTTLSYMLQLSKCLLFYLHCGAESGDCQRLWIAMETVTHSEISLRYFLNRDMKGNCTTPCHACSSFPDAFYICTGESGDCQPRRIGMETAVETSFANKLKLVSAKF